MADAIKKSRKTATSAKKSGGGKSRKVRVGKEWTRNELDVASRDRRARTAVAVLLSVLFASMLIGYWLYAVNTGDSPLLEHVFAVVRLGVFALIAWALGPRLFKMVSGLRFQDPDDEEK
jgi:hypothetical protein